jgi:multiple sugar transport system ATP-binding protein
MNILPCRLEQAGSGLRARVSDTIALPVPSDREPRYRSFVGKDMILGLRPEHITEPRHNGRTDGCDFDVTLDVVEPMGMETMVFFTINGTEYCSRVEPSSASDAGTKMRLQANVDHMHLIDPASGAVI